MLDIDIDLYVSKCIFNSLYNFFPKIDKNNNTEQYKIEHIFFKNKIYYIDKLLFNTYDNNSNNKINISLLAWIDISDKKFKMIVRYQYNWIIYFIDEKTAEIYSLDVSIQNLLKHSFLKFIYYGYKEFYDINIKNTIKNITISEEYKKEFDMFIENKYEIFPLFDIQKGYFMNEYTCFYINVQNKIYEAIMIRTDKVIDLEYSNNGYCVFTLNNIIYMDDLNNFNQIIGLYYLYNKTHTFLTYFNDINNKISDDYDFYKNIFISKNVKI